MARVFVVMLLGCLSYSLCAGPITIPKSKIETEIQGYLFTYTLEFTNSSESYLEWNPVEEGAPLPIAEAVNLALVESRDKLSPFLTNGKVLEESSVSKVALENVYGKWFYVITICVFTEYVKDEAVSVPSTVVVPEGFYRPGFIKIPVYFDGSIPPVKIERNES